MCHAYDRYTTNLPLAEALKPDVLLVHTADGAPLPVEHGGPVRVITPQLYTWKGAKWIKRLELMTEDRAAGRQAHRRRPARVHAMSADRPRTVWRGARPGRTHRDR